MRTPRLPLAVFLTTVLLTVPTVTSVYAHICWNYAESQPPTNLTECGGIPPTTIIEQHGNWHCAFPATNNAAWGAAFIGFHRQFILDFDIWRLDLGIDRLRIWEAIPGDPIPGNDEDFSSGFTHCWDYPGGSDDATSRAQNAPCNSCASVPLDLVGSGLDTYTSLGAVGARLHFSGWHGGFHCGGAEAGGGLANCSSASPGIGCDDLAFSTEAPHDPAFWMGHKMLDELAKDWQVRQAADIVLVIDRSGSMDDNCPGGNADPGETPCKINDAKEAAKLFADLVQDDRPGSSDEHRIGLVSFSSTATKHLGGSMIAAANIVTEGGGEETQLEMALDGLSASGGTSIGEGILAALDVLATGSNPHQAIVILSDGMETAGTTIQDVRDMGVIDDVQICAIGFGGTFSDPDDKLRSLAEDYGGVFIADPEATDNPITLEKFFVDCFGQISDEVLSEDPILTVPAGQVATTAIKTGVCGSDSRLTVVLGRDPALPECDLRLVVTTPAGNLVDLGDPAVESGHDKSWHFARIPLPYRGEAAGVWKAFGVRPQRVYTHGFATDSYTNMSEGVALVRREIHRLFPQGGIGSALYYEDGSITGGSAYAAALQKELAAGNLGSLVIAATVADFDAALAQPYDLIVFARQMNPTPQPFDTTLAGLLCQGQKALITDFYAPAAATNPVLTCAGVIPGSPINYEAIVGDGRLVEGVIPLTNPGYNLYALTVAAGTGGGPSLVQATHDLGEGSIVGTGSTCPAQTYFASTLVRGFGKVRPVSMRPRVTLGQRILASFRMTPWTRPVGDWDAVNATLTVDRPGLAPPDVYPLRDDGTGGDVMAGDNFWELEVPVAASTVGSHLLRAEFELTKDGCTIHREAEYTVTVQPDPQVCTRSICPPPRTAAPGKAVGVLACARNLCRADDEVEITVTDTSGWLCLEDPLGNQTPVASVVTQYALAAGKEGECFLTVGTNKLMVCVPPDAQDGESTIVTYDIRSLGHPNQETQRCSAEVRADSSIPVSVPQPEPSEGAFHVTVSPMPTSGSMTFTLQLPQSGRAQLRIYDLRGRHVATVLDRDLPAGSHTVEWLGDDQAGSRVAAGVYFYQSSAGGEQRMGKVIVLR